MNLAHLMRDTVTISSQTDYTGGAPTFGAQTTIKARVEHKKRLVVDPDNNELESNHAIATYDEVKTTDRVWLPGDDTGSTDAARRPIDVIKAERLHGGRTLYEVYL